MQQLQPKVQHVRSRGKPVGVDTQIDTGVLTRHREAQDTVPTQPTHRRAATTRRETRVDRSGLSVERQHGEYDRQADGDSFKTCWPFTRVDGKILERAHKEALKKQRNEIGEALL